MISLLAASACGPTDGGEQALVKRVVDGDTVELSSGEIIRYLLVDTPEVSGTTECFGPQAEAFNRDLVEGKKVGLHYDEEHEDRFGRTLAYVSIQDRDVSELLIERGYGCVLFIPPNGADRVEHLKSLEAAARAERRGMWGTCESNPCN